MIEIRRLHSIQFHQLMLQKVFIFARPMLTQAQNLASIEDNDTHITCTQLPTYDPSPCPSKRAKLPPLHKKTLHTCKHTQTAQQEP